GSWPRRRSFGAIDSRRASVRSGSLSPPVGLAPPTRTIRQRSKGNTLPAAGCAVIACLLEFRLRRRPAASDRPHGGAMQALDNLIILDLTHHICGPYATKLFADFGADVIKIEKPG